MNVSRKVFYKDLIEKSSGGQKKPFLGNEETAWRAQDPPFKDKVVLNKIISLVIFSLRRLWSYKTSLITWLRQCLLAGRSV